LEINKDNIDMHGVVHIHINTIMCDCTVCNRTYGPESLAGEPWAPTPPCGHSRSSLACNYQKWKQHAITTAGIGQQHPHHRPRRLRRWRLCNHMFGPESLGVGGASWPPIPAVLSQLSKSYAAPASYLILCFILSISFSTWVDEWSSNSKVRIKNVWNKNVWVSNSRSLIFQHKDYV
jgi:hypothetical protein